MNGVELCARFSYITNSLGFCGPSKAHKLILNYLMDKSNDKELESALLKFEGISPYLSSIAEKSGKKIWDYDVVEAYWIGNSLLDNWDIESMKNIIRKLMLRGLPKSYGTKLMEKMQPGLFPHHNFNVFYVGVGMLTRSVETNLQNMNNCMISSGKILGLFDNNLIVEIETIKAEKGKYFIGEKEIKTAFYLKEMLTDIKINDYVALHWGFAALEINEIQKNSLDNYTKKILNILNNMDK